MDTIQHITNFLPINDQLASGGQPMPEEIQALAETGFQVVINLAVPTSTHALPDEGSLVTQYGMTYLNIPVVWTNPTLDDFVQFMGCMTAFRWKKVFVHCAMNMRVSCFLFLYWVIVKGVEPEEASKNMLEIWQPDETWQQFMVMVLAHYTARPDEKKQE